MRYLATLIAHPGLDIPAIELAAGGDPPQVAGEGATSHQAESRQFLLDGIAVREYRRRLAQLEADIDDYESMRDLQRAAQAQRERDWLVSELESAAGLSGRIRQFSNDTERARVAVGKALHRALDRLSASDSFIAAEIRTRLKTGLRCSFRFP
jgi:hypothetical protein